MSVDILLFFKEFKNQKIYFNDVLDYWDKNKPELDYKEKIVFIDLLLKDDVFRWLYLISKLVPEIVFEIPSISQEIVDLIKRIIDRVRNDMTQGIFMNSLITIGENKPGIAIEIINKLIDKDYDVYAGFILAGIIQKDFQYLKSFQKEGINNGKKIGILVALSTMFRDSKSLGNKEEYVKNVITELSNPKEDIEVKRIAVLANFDLYKFLPGITYNNLLQLSKKTDDSRLLYNIAERLWIHGLNNIERDFELASICSHTKDVNVLDRIMLFLSKNGHKKPKKAFDIILNILESDLAFKIPSFDYSLNEMGKNNIEEFEEVFKKHILNNALEATQCYMLSYAIYNIYNYHMSQMDNFITYLTSLQTAYILKFAQLLKNRKMSRKFTLE